MLKSALRWVIALPVGLVAALLVMLPVHWGILLIYYLSGSNPDSVIRIVDAGGEERGCGLGLTCVVPPESLERMAQAFVIPFVTLTVVARIVPRHKFYIVAALCVVYLLMLGGVMPFILTNGAYSGWGWLEFAAVLALGIGGAAGAVYSQFQTWRETRWVN